MDGNVQNASEQSTTSEPMERQEGNEANGELDTAPQGEGNESGASTPGGEGAAAEEEPAEDDAAPFLEVRFNHETRGLSRDEAATLAQKGIRFESSIDNLNTLERLATLKGQTPEEFLKGIESAEDEAYKQSLIDKFGDDSDTVDHLMELYFIKKQEKLTNADNERRTVAKKEEEDENSRLADEFLQLQKEFPDIADFASLPKEVKSEALNGKHLLDAYLLHRHREQKRIDAANKTEKQAAQKTTGAIDTSEHTDGSDSFIKGLWSR